MSTAFTSPTNSEFRTLMKELLITHSEHQGAQRSTPSIPVWRDTTTYSAEQKVIYNNDFWFSAQSSNLNHIPENGEWWKVSTIDLQASTIKTLQSWLISNCRNIWVDYSYSDFEYYGSIANWLSHIGFNAKGFRKAKEWVVGSDPVWIWPTEPYVYNYIERGDIIGWWIWEDLQKAFSSLRWTMWGSGTADAQYRSGSGQDPDCVHAKDSYDISYGGSSWTNTTNHNLYGIVATKKSSVGLFSGVRYRGKGYMGGHYTAIPHEADCYVDLDAPSWGTFKDLDGLGYIQGRNHLQNFPESSAIEHTTNLIGNISTSPIALAGYSCPWSDDIIEGSRSYDSRWRMKWNFTNQNP